MGNKTAHLQKYRKNKKLSNEHLMCKEDNWDWRTIMIYYSALHIIDSNLANYDRHPPTHEIRKGYVNSLKDYKGVIDEYYTLESLSRKARYDCFKIKEKEVKNALISLNKIEKHFNLI